MSVTTDGLTPHDAPKFDFSAYPPDTFFHERRSGRDRRREAFHGGESRHPAHERRVRKERRRRVDPTTFDKQYTAAEIEFMNAMEEFKVQHVKPFPSHREVLEVAHALGYRKSPCPVDC